MPQQNFVAVLIPIFDVFSLVLSLHAVDRGDEIPFHLVGASLDILTDELVFFCGRVKPEHFEAKGLVVVVNWIDFFDAKLRGEE